MLQSQSWLQFEGGVKSLHAKKSVGGKKWGSFMTIWNKDWTRRIKEPPAVLSARALHGHHAAEIIQHSSPVGENLPAPRAVGDIPAFPEA